MEWAEGTKNQGFRLGHAVFEMLVTYQVELSRGQIEKCKASTDP